MAGVIQLGDAIKFAEFAWTVWEYGWARENNAGQHYRDFGSDVRILHNNLTELENAVRRAQESLRSHGARARDSLGGDQYSLLEVIGDYNATLMECDQLLRDNRRYAETTGPIKNIDWNINIMPQVEHLRGRIQMHSTRIQHVLKPFQIDLVTNIHNDLIRRMQTMHMGLHGVMRTVTALLQDQNPILARQIEKELETEICAVGISENLLGRLERMLERRRPLELSLMADCFLYHLQRATFQPQLGSNSFPHNATWVPNYLPFAKCQVLMNRMKELEDIQNPRRTSVWPGYIRGLEEELSEAYSRVQSVMIVPDTSMCRDEILAFWPEDEPRTVVAPKEPLVEHISLFQGPLATLSPNISRREIKLQRQLGSNYRFKIVETIESNCQPPIEDPKDLDFDIRSTVLIPLYADPLGCSTATRPPEIMIEVDENKTQRHYRFLFLQDLLAFQAILTGFKVVDGYMEPRAIVRFIMSGDYGDELGDLHDATIQIWIPKEWTDADRSAEDTPANDQGGRASGYGLSTPSLVQKSWDRNGSNILPNRCGTISNPNLRTSPPLVRKSWDWTGQNLLPERWETVSPPDVRTSPPANGSSNTVNSPTMSPMTTTDQFRQPERQNRSNSISSYLSIATNSSGASHSSQGSKHNVPVKLGDGSVGTGYGTVRNPPRNPLLVLFTRPKGPESRRSIVAITLHTKTMPNRTTCKCEQTTECKITALQNAHSLVDAHKFEGDKWDLLRLVASRHDMPRRWDKLIRVSIMFPAPLLRMKFGGGPCWCSNRTEGELEVCHLQGHQGLLGVVRDYHRRLLIQYHNETDNQLDLVNHPPYG
ncbi:hypothetical protein FVEN_g6444 [Fusarium venenatum]|uniref:Uncharacterized protein n=1 Tax=Fusarium venenatum TaxID=56646 RepID=A0A2L2TM48_9HYPO|nr:uncharacterized protein FVRRES_04711 [Fusarium venenatum]KAG8355721.1 hypothetical protein FVEN_g6444 [Fusarium venenatum]KAH6991864.1 hypothetical protein EDB82DRAFT_122923 [Fusarium venenatum]CEI60275.1 unnamed protein product [Fusarium venenatum]